MQKITYYCDRCGKRIDKEVCILGVRYADLESEERTDSEIRYGAELCFDCYHEINEMTAYLIDTPAFHFDGGSLRRCRNETH